MYVFILNALLLKLFVFNVVLEDYFHQKQVSTDCFLFYDKKLRITNSFITCVLSEILLLSSLRQVASTTATVVQKKQHTHIRK